MTEKRYGHPKFYELLEAEAELHSRKNSDYAADDDPLSNLRMCEQIILVCPKCKHHFKMPAWIGVIVRLMDKWSRIIQLIPKVLSGEGPAVKGESIKDSLTDNSVYSKLDIVVLDEWIEGGQG